MSYTDLMLKTEELGKLIFAKKGSAEKRDS